MSNPVPSAAQDMPQQLLRPINVGDQAYAPPPGWQQPTLPIGAAPAMPAVTVAKITTAICRVMAKVGVIEKQGVNEFFHYRFVQMQDVLQVLTPLMAEAGIAVLQTEVKRELDDGGKALAVTYAFTICHSSGEIWPERMMWTGSSIARNRNGTWDDKALNKCATAARKYCLLSLFQVPTGDEPDADKGENDGDIRTARDDARQDVEGNKSRATYDALRGELSALQDSGAEAPAVRAWAVEQNDRINKLVSEHYDAFRMFYSGIYERAKAKATTTEVEAGVKAMQQSASWKAPPFNSPTTPKPEGEQLTDNQIADILEQK